MLRSVDTSVLDQSGKGCETSATVMVALMDFLAARFISAFSVLFRSKVTAPATDGTFQVPRSRTMVSHNVVSVSKPIRNFLRTSLNLFFWPPWEA